MKVPLLILVLVFVVGCANGRPDQYWCNFKSGRQTSYWDIVTWCLYGTMAETYGPLFSKGKEEEKEEKDK